MEHEDGLTPIGEMLGELPVPLKPAKPQAVHHFTQADQVNQLVSASEADPDMGFQARMMALCSLPRTNPGNRLQYVRKNGPYKLAMIAGAENKLPYGSLARLLMAWISTEAVKTQSPVLVLGHSLTDFMNKLDINSESAGRSGERTRLRNQMDRLFNSTVQFIYEPKAPDGASLGVKDTFSSTVARKMHLVWNPKKPNEPVLWESTVELGHDFFHDILRHPFPLDMNHAEGAQAFAPGPRSLHVGGLPDVQPDPPYAALLAVALPAVRGGPVESERQVGRE